eukprot:CAMPEP_0185761634 /NCGR_PEP_ID=MMETSP1174-20130828/20581_1 /TAXON_ID=35687 /ORGANISM="Dictyocha speculum, Strain CCMP1381" /LENGTH=121 /DNA_ID=CAMNT_0028442959 /DNA_START=74 /DNA_END=437 /DNA_ORIENTATION=-
MRRVLSWVVDFLVKWCIPCSTAPRTTSSFFSRSRILESKIANNPTREDNKSERIKQRQMHLGQDQHELDESGVHVDVDEVDDWWLRDELDGQYERVELHDDHHELDERGENPDKLREMVDD